MSEEQRTIEREAAILENEHHAPEGKVPESKQCDSGTHTRTDVVACGEQKH